MTSPDPQIKKRAELLRNESSFLPPSTLIPTPTSPNLQAGFHPFFSAREQTFGKVQTAPAAKSRAEFSGEFSEELSTYSGTRESSGEKISGGAEADPEEDPGANLAVGHPHHHDDIRDPDDDHNRQSHYDHDHPNHDNDHNQDDEQYHDRRDDERLSD